MMSLSRRSVTLFAGVIVASAAAVLGSGVASADDPLVGKTYADATAQIKKWSGHPILSTVVGDQLSMDKCTVASWRKDTKTGKFFLSLFCDTGVATAKDAGNSAGSPTGRSAKQHDINVEYLHQHPEVCLQMKADHPDWFKKPMDGCEGVT